MLPFGFARFGSLLLLTLLGSIREGRASPDAGSDPTAIGSACCRSLSGKFPSQVLFPNSPPYNDSVSSYWAQQEQLISPLCIVLPTSADDVAATLQVLYHGSCKFAVRSGGHGTSANASNIDNGVTIDLSALDFILLSGDRSAVAVGPGQTVGDVYALLYKAGLSFAGARDSGIGIGGSTLGGGLGYFSPFSGFACDSVVEYEVVLGNGTIISATQDNNSDLWHALKGGGNNFGIVTKFVFKVFPLGSIWTGQAAYAPSAVNNAAQAFYDFVSDPNYDNSASLLMSYGYNGGSTPLIELEYVYAAPVVDPPSAFAKFYALEGQVANETGITSAPALSIKSGVMAPGGQQQVTFAMSFQNNAQMLPIIWTMYNSSIDSISSIDGIAWILTFEPVVQSLVNHSKANGGNILGLDISSQGLVLAHFSASFDNAADYSTVSIAAEKLLQNINGVAKKIGTFNPYVDLNYAKTTQEPFLSYGSDNYSFLKAAAKRYDPALMFQNLMPGGFKLS
ncbi:uncharacterized protein F4822DRAFT_220141 [Hypoxylon trugodes]|uniref:uncharacterized protein n=1 Tax=Hypoxylon trugodes TaxID=326681 RepID=UPI0021908E11|nr:uncharacterized protein F4822DRAFT_220141 [Hypoxylon trugodes]KAI1389989.1 hypothetical protein F4822DRAFT_220141 [Hypoxylon trugodes]